jgi:hypothetical protein
MQSVVAVDAVDTDATSDERFLLLLVTMHKHRGGPMHR